MQATFTITFVIAPAPQPLAIANSTFTGTVGTSISGTLGITGGAPPYTVNADPAALPPGVTLDGTGNVGGTPTTEGTTSVPITVADSQG